MPQLLIRNTSSQHIQFNWLPNPAAPWRARNIPPGAEVSLGDLPPGAIEKIIDFYERREAIVETASLPLRPDYRGLSYRLVDTTPEAA
jgi:hypothetical protein